MKPGKHQRNKQRCQNSSWKVHVPAQSLCMSYVTSMFLLVSPSVRSKQLLWFVQGQGQKKQQKHTTRNFVEFHNHSPLLTMNESRRKTRNLQEAEPINQLTRSKTTPYNKAACFFCDGEGCNRENLRKVRNMNAGTSLCEALELSRNTSFLSNSLLQSMQPMLM